MTLRINTNKLKNAMVFCLLFFAAMNFKAKFFYFAFTSFAVLIVTQRTLKLNNTSLVYLGLGVLMAVYNSDEGILSMLRCISHFALYLVGYNMSVSVPDMSADSLDSGIRSVQKTGFVLLAAICAGSFTHYLLNAVSNINSIIGRNTIDVWSGEIMAATGQATLACLMLGLSVAMIYMPTKKHYRYIGIVCIVGMLAYNLVLAGRTMIVVLCALFILGFIYTGKVTQNSMEKFKLGMGLTSAVVVIAIVFLYNVGGIQDYVFNSNLFDRFGFSLQSYVSDASRVSNKIGFILNGWKYPLGGLNMRSEYGYAHDLLLDGYDEYGIIGLLLLVAILVFGIRALYKLLKYSSYSNEFKLAALCIYCAVLLEFCVEPILAGMSWLFACYSLVNGCMDGMNYSYYLSKSE